MSTSLIVLCVAFVVGAVLRIPVVLTMFGSGIVYLWVSGQDVGLLVDQTLNNMMGMNAMLAVPMFILAANVMNAATISERLWSAANLLVGRLRGGHGHVTVLMNVAMSSMTGSAVSEASGAGMVAIRMMRNQGHYPGGLAVAVASGASLLGPIMPPSIPLVLYAVISGASVGALFLAGIVPAFLMALSLSILISIMAHRRNLPRAGQVARGERLKVIAGALVPLTLPAVLLGGIWSGIFTPTEAASVAALWAILLGFIVYRNLNMKSLLAVFLESSRQSAVVMMLIISSFIINYAITNEGLADNMAAWIKAMNLSPLQFMLLVNVLFLVLGTVLDGAVMLMVFVPVLLPSVHALGIDPVHFGVVSIINFMIAIITPPYGLILFVLSTLTKVPMREINREIWAFCVPLTIVMFILVLFPQIVLFLPRMFGFQ
ncbi:MAG: TRAP transporter large permease [Chelatococcus sp.]|jgi:C4-dicarboxylate transporter DctM subunit|uniref:TRAP transporter large permease n=1 Tax=unclassified Chelatococcus TaxID=2638111 RepID=UPI001BCDC89A|nr:MULTISPECIES: TRAP transporter large permease [unclassified Chelatococcus]CAH1661131.1 Tripartite ATP-independent transporter DctM subunit [Hyphomicrobiales bacterium]MBS7741217.1 TRAP transporter large permease [Chelatococcus sp. HY11]MBX3538412.1 TRAP transporter large permease [Chelatococcus sp.]MBX3545403.1 TRAP transporter large permease [Chelatococcus sp.]MCO5078039.1 TRAP transporter large permease [Chelatococcus sp.]